ncbi:MAG: dTDP-4-dehydrorhamnose reductase [Chitinispirillales bacterium]|jgi:dTDP-4-dehydrorhamnose reductase|nr:dTDP-4-dehydrorhamnose reductase [Chitinispirillales bacterium]
MKLLVIGSGGQLGSDFVKEAERFGHSVFPVDFPDIDIADKASVSRFVNDTKPDVIVNCAAFTAVDLCEQEPEKAFSLNADACLNLASCARDTGARLVHFSTDYVFDGRASIPYTEYDEPRPQTVYGKSKLRGEEFIAETCPEHFIFRIAWLYGVHGNNFVKSIRRFAQAAANEKKPLKVVNDQFGTPTWTVSVCRQALKVFDKNEYGIFHCTSEGQCSWFDFAKEIVSASGIGVDIESCTTEEFPRPAPRPHFSVLENARLKAAGINIMPEWREAFKEFLLAETYKKGE